MADAVATFVVDGKTYYATANEGDARDGGGDEARAGAVTLDPAVLGRQVRLAVGLGELALSDGDLPRSGDLRALLAALDLSSEDRQAWEGALPRRP
jgi:alkaline phosphatase